MIKKLIYKLRYANHLNKITKCGMRHAWYCAGVEVDENDWWNFEPEEAASEEAGNWRD